MEEKINNESDKFKLNLRKKIVDEPVTSVNDHQIWENVMKDINVKANRQTKKAGTWYWYAAAAIVMLGLTITFILLQNQTNSQNLVNKAIPNNKEIAEQPNKKDTTKTPANTNAPYKEEPKSDQVAEHSSEQKNISETIYAKDNIVNHKLPDGTVVTINVGSHITTDYSNKNTREISINGEAYFEVIPNKSRPFIVHFGTYKLEVVGTKFNVRNIETESIKEVTVTEGIVKVFENKNTSILVKAGEQVKLQNSKEHVLAHVEAINFVSWKTNVLNFKSSKLGDVTEILSRIHHCEIRLDSHVKECLFSGDLSELKLDEALEVLKLASNLKIETKHHKVYITGHGCD